MQLDVNKLACRIDEDASTRAIGRGALVGFCSGHRFSQRKSFDLGDQKVEGSKESTKSL
jgi:hypothetical protein